MRVRYTRWNGAAPCSGAVIVDERVLVALMRSRVPVLVVAHQAVLRVFYAFFTDTDPNKCTRVAIPLHTLFIFPPTADGRNTCETHLLLPLPEGASHE
jgi:broad specificity phosphatase PhoE